jgi:hypothetical protein
MENDVTNPFRYMTREPRCFTYQLKHEPFKQIVLAQFVETEFNTQMI